MSLSLAGSGQISGFDPVASGFGGLVAVKHVLKTDTFVSGSIAAGGNVAVTGLSITHAVADADNRLIISAFFGAAANNEGRGRVGIAVNDGTNFLSVGNADGSRLRITAGGITSSGAASFVVLMPSVTFVHSPNTTGSLTYTVHAFNVDAFAARTLYVNRSETDGNSASNPRSASALVIQEVAV